MLFVWKLRGFKVLKNEQMTSEMSGSSPVSSSEILILLCNVKKILHKNVCIFICYDPNVCIVGKF